MAIVKAKYVRSKPRIKAHLRYITHRRGGEGERISRPLFGRDGALSKQHIYDMIDATRRGAVFHKFVINFHPIKEDTNKAIPFGIRFAALRMSCYDHVFQVHSTSLSTGPDLLSSTTCRRNLVCGTPNSSCV